MENPVFSSSDRQNSRASLRSNSLDNYLSLSLQSLRLRNAGAENNSACVYPCNNNAFGLPCNGPFTTTMFDGHNSSYDGNQSGETMSTDWASVGRENLFINAFSLLPAPAYQNPPPDCQYEPIAEAGSYVSYGFYNGLTGNSGGFRFQESLNHAFLPHMNTIIENALTQDGSEKLRNLLSLKEPRITNKIFEGVIDFIFELITNQYGHDLFAELIKLCSNNQLHMIVERITSPSLSGGIITASETRTGSYSIKKLIKVLKKSPLLIKVIATMQEGFHRMMISQSGSCVILKCLDLLDTQTNELLYVAAMDHCLKLAVDEQGCISLNYFIDNIRGPNRSKLLHVIAKNSLYLSQDPSGNYVVQKVVELQNPDIIQEICSQLKGHIVKISMQKGGSHVVEKILNSRGMDHAVTEFLESKQLLQVAKNQYGNYVVQTALKASKHAGSHLYQELMIKLQKHLDALQHGYGRNVYSLINAGVPNN